MPVVRTVPAADQGEDRRETGRLLLMTKLLRAMCDDERFDAEDIGLMVALARYTNANATCFPSQKLLGEKLNKSRPWVNSHLAELVDKGIIRKTRRAYASNGERSCLYEIVFDLAVKSEKDDKAKKDVATISPMRRVPTQQRHGLSVSTLPPRGTGEDTSFRLPVDTVCQDPDTVCQTRDTNLFNSKPSEHEKKESRDWHDDALSSPLSIQTVHPTHHCEGDGVKGGVGEAVVDLEMAALAKRLQRSSSKPWKLATASKVVEAAVARVGIDVVRQVAEDDLIGAGLPPWEMAACLEALRPRKPRTTEAGNSSPTHGPAAVTTTDRAPAPRDGCDERDAREANKPLASLFRTPKSATDLQVERLAVRYIDQLDPITRNVVWFNRARAAGCPSNRSHDTASWAPWVAYQFLEENHHRALAKIVAEAVVTL